LRTSEGRAFIVKMAMDGALVAVLGVVRLNQEYQ
jgi:hypothetical protein